MHHHWILAALLAGCTQADENTEAPEPAAAPAAAAAETGIPKPKHVVLISVDTLRADHVGAYGSAVKTPGIDALAADSVRFARAWPAATTTLASHSTMMTGDLPHSHGVPFNGAILAPGNVTLAEILKDNGFSTVGVVGGTPVQASTGLGQGFDVYEGPTRPGPRGNESVAKALEPLADKPTFLFVHYWDAHWPYTPPAPWNRMYRTDDLPVQGTFAEVRQLRKDLKKGVEGALERSEAMKNAYAGAVSYTDDSVGKLIADLKQRGIYDDALIIFTSDHGESTDEHWDYWTHGKSTYEVAIHVPLLIKLPGQMRAGATVDTPVSLTDLLPTVLELLSISDAEDRDGVSLTAALAGKPFARAPIFVEATAPSRKDDIGDGTVWINDTNCAAVLDGDLKYHHCPWRKRSELYNLASDAGEQNDLMASQKAAADPLAKTLEGTRSSTAGQRVALENSEEMTQALQALGYIEEEDDKK